MRITVEFDTVGVKKLLLKFARFKNHKPMKIEEIPTPFYIVYEEKLRRNLELISRVKQEAGVNIIMAFKANALWKTFPIIKEYVTDSTASSLNEMHLGNEELGGNVHSIVPPTLLETINEYLNGSSHITFNSVNQFNRFKADLDKHNTTPATSMCRPVKGQPAMLGNRNRHIQSRPSGSRFGVTAEQLGDTLPEGYRRAALPLIVRIKLLRLATCARSL